MRHKKHKEISQISNLFKKVKCAYKEKCFFLHKSANEETKNIVQKLYEN